MGGLLCADMNAATPPGSRGRSVLCAAYVVVTGDLRVNGTCTVQRMVVDGQLDVNGVFGLDG